MNLLQVIKRAREEIFKLLYVPAELIDNDDADSTEMEEEPMDDETLRLVRRNLYWQEELEWKLSTVVGILGTDAITVESVSFVSAVQKWQRLKGLTEDGIVGPNTWAAMVSEAMAPKERAVRKIMEPTVGKESSGRYWAVNLDGEYRGLFNNHRAEGRTHIGLSFGILQFTQDGGALGTFLKECAKRNPHTFKSIMGRTWDTLIAVTTRPGPTGLNSGVLRGPRVHKVLVEVDANGTVDERDLWEEPWVSKFIKLGKVPEFQVVQRELAQRDYLEPMLPNLKRRGLYSERLVAAVFSGAIHRGVGGMRSFMDRCMDPLGDEFDDKAVLDEMIRRNPGRFASFKNDDSLSWDEWSGWAYF